MKQYHDLITAHQRGIFEKTAFDISQYTSDYRVQVREGIADEFKAIYFLGMNIAKCLIENQKLKKQHHGAVLDLLDYRLAEPHKANRPKLTARILSMIDKDHIEQNLGKHGWYLLYKCLFNAAQDHQTGSKEVL
ncbi:MAG: hypothetical protein QM527_10815 [Alphaproteobacteria bacterium]|nr:hypothetical protein [Alphaproteobacteria bacterium]